jgi:alpha-beta hydrolase superfamily lysophospholipase
MAMGAVVYLTPPKAPPLIASIEKADDAIGNFSRDLPAYSFYQARDGAKLAYRYYPGKAKGGVVVVVHGSSGTSVAVHQIARSLQSDGFSVYAIDLRGHGRSGPLGDVAYHGQNADDLHDLISLIAGQHPGEKRLLMGHSLGGSFVLRVASDANAGDFDAYLALSPFMGANTPMDRPDEGGWTSVSVPRIIVASILDRWHLPIFDHVRVIAFAMARDGQDNRPAFYTQALLASLTLPRDWQAALKGIHRPAKVMIGANDELFYADKYRQAIESANPAIKVTTISGVGHMDMVYDERALAAEVETARSLLER